MGERGFREWESDEGADHGIVQRGGKGVKNAKSGCFRAFVLSFERVLKQKTCIFGTFFAKKYPRVANE